MPRSTVSSNIAMLLALSVCGCDEETRPASHDPEPASTDVVVDETDPIDETPPSDVVAPVDVPGAAEVIEAAPEVGCAFAAPQRVWPRPGWVDVAAGENGSFVVAGTSWHDAHEEIFVSLVAAGAAPVVLLEATLPAGAEDARRAAAPALVVSARRGLLAVVDGEMRFRMATFSASGRGAIRHQVIAEHASLRFSPALAAFGEGYVAAWTQELGTPMRVFASRLDSRAERQGDAQDMTPLGGGAAAPAFVDGAEVLIFLDPRAAVSVALRSTYSTAGFATVTVARPLNLVAEPPAIAVVRIGDSDWLGYTAVGSVATTAIGWLALDRSAPPTALVPGTGYGTLFLDGAAFGAGAVFVGDVPTGRARESPRRVQLRLVSPRGALGDPLAILDENELGARGRVAVGSDGSSVAVTYATDDGVHIRIGRCAAPTDPDVRAQDISSE